MGGWCRAYGLNVLGVAGKGFGFRLEVFEVDETADRVRHELQSVLVLGGAFVFRISGFWRRSLGPGYRISSFGPRVPGSGFRIPKFRIWVLGFRLRV